MTNLSEYPVRRRNPDLLSISNPGDFVVDPGRWVDSSRMFDLDVSPYCFDLPSQALLCVSTTDISGAPFFYQAQRQCARSVIKVPFGSLPDGAASPTLIFSIGRCGSTLLIRALEAAAVRCVSEPDFYRQAARYWPSDISLRTAIAGATRLLPYSVIKLHLECNHAPLLIAGAFGSPRIMFILRDPVDWAASLRRISRNVLEPARAVAHLRTGLAALGQLAQQYPVRVCYYEEFRTLDHDRVQDVLSWIGESGTVSRETLNAVAAKDAQEGTFVSRAAVRDVPDDPRFREAFRLLWTQSRPAELIARLRLPLL